MKTRTMWVTVITAAVLVVLAGGAGALSGPEAPEAIVAATINYQGRLTDPGGTPLSGTFPMRFRVYDDPVADTILWDSGVVNVDVDNGLFNVGLAVDPADVNGQGLWLHIYVDGEWLAPRQALRPVPYALSLRPGAEIAGDSAGGWILKASNSRAPATGAAMWAETATGNAVYAKSTGGVGLFGYSPNNFAVYGLSSGGTTGHGYGGYFYSQTGVGAYGYSDAGSYYTNMYAPGVYGRSKNGAGVYGVSENTVWPGYGGVFEGRTGLYARSSGDDTRDGYAGIFISENYRGLYVLSQDGWYDGYFAGVGGIYAANYWSMQAGRTVVVNGGDEPLAPGDVVAITGVAAAPLGTEPLLAVRKADAAHAPAVVGVVIQAMRLEMVEVEPTMDPVPDLQPVAGDAPPGGYLAIATDGLVPAVKVEAPAGGLEIGDQLTVSPAPGRVREAGPGSEGTILGKVAGPVDAETGTVPVFVVLR